jgi:hypothetical protein
VKPPLSVPIPTLALLVLLSAGCGTGDGDLGLSPTTNPAFYARGVSHGYFPLVPGTLWVYEGDDEGLPLREEVRILAQERVISGVPCVGVEERAWVDGELKEVTTEWYAEDRRGNVWKFGEESFEADDLGGLVPTADSWLAGQPGTWPWLALSADPQPGDVIAGYTPVGQDDLYVQSVSETAVVPAGTFLGCLQILENPDEPDDTDIILYAPGVGRVSEQNASGSMQLTEHRQE